MELPNDAKHIWAAYKLGYRIGITYDQDGEMATYHFILDPRTANIENVYCVQCSSVFTDPLRILGLSIAWSTFERDYLTEDRQVRTIPKKMTRTLVRVYPKDWDWSWDQKKQKEEIQALQHIRPLIEMKGAEFTPVPAFAWNMFTGYGMIKN